MASGRWEWGPQAKRDPGDVGVRAAGPASLSQETPSQQCSPNSPTPPPIQVPSHGVPPPKCLPFPSSLLSLPSLRPLSPHLCTTGSFPSRLSSPLVSPQPVPAFPPGLSLAMLPHGLLSLPSLALKGPQGSGLTPFPADSVAEVTQGECESQSLACCLGFGGSACAPGSPAGGGWALVGVLGQGSGGAWGAM